MNGIKKIITNIMFVTGASLVILAVFSVLLNVEIHFVPTVFEIFAANIIIILGLFLRWKFEIRNIILEYLVDISYIIVVLVVFGLIFDWYSAIPVWLLVAMAVVIYIFAMIISVTKINKDAKELNRLLQKRQKKQADSAS
jgi:peptidoglycan/LPS O-acetylase OafA/YrhL